MDIKDKNRNEYRGKFDLFLYKYKKLGLTKEELEKERAVIKAEIERIKHYKVEYKRKDYFSEYMACIATILAFYGLPVSVLEEKYSAVKYLLVFIAGIATIYICCRVYNILKKEENKEKDIDSQTKEEKELFIDLNIEMQVIEYLLNLNKEVAVDETDKNNT